jgi:hypothetical protein
VATESNEARRRTRWRSRVASGLILWLAIWLGLLPALADAREPVEVKVAEPLMELRTGPGRGYPVYYVAERGETVQILKRRTDWFKVRTERNREGWVSHEQIENAMSAEGVQQSVRDAVLEDFLRKRVEAGFAAGRFDGDPVVSFRAGYLLTDNLITELSFSQVSGTFSSSQLMSGNLMLQPYAQSRFSPYLTIGGGLFENRNRASLVGSTGTIHTTVANSGLGVRFYLTRNFLLRVDYRKYVALTSVDKNDRFDEEQIGLSFFF